jgi:uncharacterized protein
MILSLADLSLRSGERYERIYLLEFAPIVQGGQEYTVLVPDGVHVMVDRVTGGYLVKVALDAKVYGPCARCLDEAVVEVHAEQQEFAPTAKDGWEETEASDFIKDLMVDVDSLAREALILALPSQVVCREDCKGLCGVCGLDLNRDSCHCADEKSDERWSRLKDLKLGEGAQGGSEGSAEGSGETGAP